MRQKMADKKDLLFAAISITLAFALGLGVFLFLPQTPQNPAESSSSLDAVSSSQSQGTASIPQSEPVSIQASEGQSPVNSRPNNPQKEESLPIKPETQSKENSHLPTEESEPTSFEENSHRLPQYSSPSTAPIPEKSSKTEASSESISVPASDGDENLILCLQELETAPALEICGRWELDLFYETETWNYRANKNENTFSAEITRTCRDEEETASLFATETGYLLADFAAKEQIFTKEEFAKTYGIDPETVLPFLLLDAANIKEIQTEETETGRNYHLLADIAAGAPTEKWLSLVAKKEDLQFHQLRSLEIVIQTDKDGQIFALSGEMAFIFSKAVAIPCVGSFFYEFHRP